MERNKNLSNEPNKTTGSSTGATGGTGSSAGRTGSSGPTGGSPTTGSPTSTGSPTGSSTPGGGATGGSLSGGPGGTTGSPTSGSSAPGSTGHTTGSAPQRAREHDTGGQSTYDQTMQSVTDAYGKTTEVLTNTYDQAMSYGRENPGKLTLIAFGAGIGIGMLLAGTGGRSRTNRIAEPVVNALSQVALEFFR